jgi:hypothetical protein
MGVLTVKRSSFCGCKLFLACFFLAVSSWEIVSGQVTSSISGRVDDASGSPVSGATVTVKSVETGATRTVTTDANGNYSVLSLPIGAQEVKAEKAGFKTAVRLGINLIVGQDATVNFKLEVGELAQQVTVTAEAPLVNISTSAVSGFVGENQIKELPLNGRSFDNLIILNSGAINYALKSPQTVTSNGNTFSVAGRRTSDNIFLINGIEYTGSSQLSVTPGGVSGSLLGIDAVREFNVLTDTYSAEYGKRAGAQVTVVTQSGSNQLHGSLFEFLRNSALDARNFFDQCPVTGLAAGACPAALPPPFRRNQFGGSLGGPLKKDTLFLFGNYEGFRQSLALSNVSVVPDSLARQGLLRNGSQVPNLNPSMLPFTAVWPAPNGPLLPASPAEPGTALSYNNPKQTAHEDFGTLRGDYNINTRDSLSASYTIDDGNSVVPQVDPLFASALRLRNQVLTLRETHIFSPNVLNTFTAGYSRAAYNIDALPLASFPSNLSFVTGGGPGGIVIGGAATTTGAAAITAAGPNGAAGAMNRRNLFTYSDTVQIVKGIHQISAGGWLHRIRDNEDIASRRLGQATFTSLTTFLQGTVSNFQVVPTNTMLGWRSWMGAWFVEDNIRLHRNLTLRLGLRHEFTDGWNEVAGRAANYITDGKGVLLTNPRVADSVFTENHAKKLFGPRVALAWDVLGNGKTAIRAGFGTYYSLIDNLAFLLNALPPYNGSASFSNTSLFNIIPITPGVKPPQSCGPGIPQPCSIFAPQGVEPDARTPTVQQWNFTVEQQITTNMALRVSYVGSFGYHGLLSIDPNTIPAQICTNPAGCLAGGIGQFTSTVPQGAQHIPVSPTRPNQYLSSAFFWYTEGNSSYNSLQIDVTRRLTRGLQFRGNYTWSKNLDINSGLTIAQATNQPQMVLDRNDVRRDWGPSALNPVHQATISGHYELPIGRGRRFASSVTGLSDKLISGWQMNAIVTMLSGFPFTPTVGANRSGDGNTRNPDRPSLNPALTGPVILGTPERWFDPNAFIRPAAGTWGNLGRGIYTGPGLANFDFSLFKNTRITEAINLQFRFEAFNLFNRTNFSAPNAIVFQGANISPSAGLITSTVTTSRQLQFGLKLIF